MPPKRGYIMLGLVACGDTAWEREGRLHGRTDLPLSDAGRASVHAAVAHLRGARISTIYHPPDEAATETAHIVAAAAHAKCKPVEGLADPDLGLLEGLLEQKVAERYPKRYKQWQGDPLSLIPPEGEPIVDARARVFSALARLLKKSRATEVAAVLHPVAFGLLRCWLADRRAGDLHHLRTDRVGIERYALSSLVLDRMRELATAEAVGES